MDGELEQGGHKEAFPAAETAKRPINQSWETWQQRGFRTMDSSRADGSQDPGRLVPCSPAAVNSPTSLGPRRLTRSCTETLEIINIYSKLPSCSHCRWEDNSGGLPRRERRVLSSSILRVDKYFITLYGAEISKVCDSKGEGQFCLHLSNPMNVPLVLEL